MNVIVAVNSDWGIGCGGTQSIVIPEDRRYFKTITEGGVVIVGRKTFEEIGRPLPNRKNIILTRSTGFKADGVVTVNSVEELLSEISHDDPDKVFVIGGGDIYKLLLPLCLYAYVTKLETAPVSDTFFPHLDKMPDWSVCGNDGTNIHDGIKYSFVRYKRTGAL